MTFIKVKKHKCKDGTISKYYYLARAYRKNGKPAAEVYYLGKHKLRGLIKLLWERWSRGLKLWSDY